MTEHTWTSPAAAAAAMREALFGPAPTDTNRRLTDFQADAVTRLTRIMDRFGGALLCDSVGLGKTHVAGEIIATAAAAGHSILVTAPAQLHSLWTRQLRDARAWLWASHTQLSRRRAAARFGRRTFDLVVVDEAHAFRNPTTRRYESLARVAFESRLLLITATPVNNSVLDFYHLLRLFAADDAFVACGVSDLRSEVEAAMEGGPHRLRRVASLVMVRRTRDDIRVWTNGSAGSTATSPALCFPAHTATRLVDYDLDAVYAGGLRRICDEVGALRFAAYAGGSRTTALELARLGLVKRLESSVAAFSSSLGRLLRLTELFRSAADNRLLFDAVRDASLALPVDDALQLTIEQIALRPWPSRLDRMRALHDADHDLAVLRCIRDAVRAARQHPDPKLQRLKHIVVDELATERIVIFTEYRATAESLRVGLERFGGIACVHGGEARLGGRRTSRRVVIDRFAPAANHARTPRHIEAVRVLVATDVLAEGVNLQDARVVVSYDLPWNPVRLAQRAGRIDRLGSLHRSIDVRAFRPTRHTESLLGLMRRIRSKVRDIRLVGGDAPAPFTSSGRRQVASRTLTDSMTTVRERLRVEHVALAGVDPSEGRAAMRWQEETAVLCCVESGAGALLILAMPDGTTAVDGAGAWDALLRASREPIGERATAVADSCIASAEAAAVRAVPPVASAPEHTVGGTMRREAVSVLRRWLRVRPGGPAPIDFAVADAVLALLRRPLPAGAELELAAALRCEPDAAVAQLAELAASLPRRTPAAAPRIVASVLLRQDRT